MEALKELFEKQNLEVLNGGQIYFDNVGIYLMVQKNDCHQDPFKYYIEKFETVVFSPKERGWLDFFGFDEVKVRTKRKEPKTQINWGIIGVLFFALAIWTIIILGVFGIW
jgi:hypothetical protein